MVLLSYATLAVVINAIGVAADPDTGNWGRTVFTQYRGGNEWANKDTVRQHIYNACFGWSGNRGALQDIYYKPWNESPYSAKLCVNTWDSHVNFEIANLNPTQGYTLTREDCNNWLKNIVDVTNNGGEWQDRGWWTRADPNAGNC